MVSMLRKTLTRLEGGMRRFLIAVCMMTLGGTVASAAELTGVELKEKLIGHRIVWKSSDGSASGVTTYQADGTVVATVDGDKKDLQGNLAALRETRCVKSSKRKPVLPLADGRKQIFQIGRHADCRIEIADTHERSTIRECGDPNPIAISES